MQSLDQEMNKEELFEATDEEQRERYTNPFSPPLDVISVLPPDHPAFDESQPEEAYDEGMDGASGVYDLQEHVVIEQGEVFR